jgi:hypothetical protein
LEHNPINRKKRKRIVENLSPTIGNAQEKKEQELWCYLMVAFRIEDLQGPAVVMKGFP